MKKIIFIGAIAASTVTAITLSSVLAVKFTSKNNDDVLNSDEKQWNNIYKFKKYELPSNEAINTHGSVMNNDKTKEAIIEYLNLQQNKFLQQNNINRSISKAISEPNSKLFTWKFDWGKIDEDQKNAISLAFWNITYKDLINQIPSFLNVNNLEIKFEIDNSKNSLKEFKVNADEVILTGKDNKQINIRITQSQKQEIQFNVRFNRNDSQQLGIVVAANQNISEALEQLSPDISFQYLSVSEDVGRGTLKELAKQYATKDFIWDNKHLLFKNYLLLDNKSYIQSVTYNVEEFDQINSIVQIDIRWENLIEKSTIKIKASDDSRIKNSSLNKFHFENWGNKVENAISIGNNDLKQWITGYIYKVQNDNFKDENLGEIARPKVTDFGFTIDMDVTSEIGKKIFKRWISFLNYEGWFQVIKSSSTENPMTTIVPYIDNLANIQFGFTITEHVGLDGLIAVEIKPSYVKMKYNHVLDKELTWKYSKNLQDGSTVKIYVKRS